MDDDVSTARVGWIGTGRMGYAMAERLVRSGLAVSVWNRTRRKAEPLAEHGAVIVDKITDLAAADVVFTMVSTDADLRDVLLGAGGLLTAARSPGVIVDCSTVSAEVSREMRAAARARGADLLCAPVSGNGKAVAAGRLSVVVSGPREASERVRPLLETIGRAVTYVGEDEAARLVKLCHNLFLGVVTQALAEVTVLADKAGVRRRDFLEFINDGVLGSVFTRYKTPALVRLDYTPTFTTELLRKDFDLGLAAARELETPMPVTALVHHLVQAAIGQGHAAEDFAALLSVQAAAAGLDLVADDGPVADGLTGTAD
ncbi:NAD(P)-dependent oxidoreductase [Actinomadura sp. KC216]|uniref:NAD(P)-dependent oxidoreductase n=1 Tax=Actinomadura sp. KC216 TaxID=2530370 RepID=UPI00104E6F6B|nr:NAD(P)-dependent oxidoreductase [Actinomadura sp. KC216]TDB87911.1 NAD(P)-dependent oxidoreductase [Actinomadura sp. KC216]